MNYLGIDYGEKRVGLSYGDEIGVAVPIPAAVDSTKKARMARIGEEIKRRRIGALVVGYPYNMDGSVGFKAKEVDAFIAELEEKFELPVYRTDERLTSQQVERGMAAMPGRKRLSPQAQRAARASGEVDSRAAALILQDYLDSQVVGQGDFLPEEDFPE
ncbi:Holliday junction resolvase RuvX [Ruficoccus sp. ZRK36]|uniref:Holliday junction resolvase RuvX n=1 Tax=Ruficoccus sp. ZRK36 TaxID=2866311 RepID=UPI001C73D8C5|nr:Holliday junction resolvase RuvX [Ruficoccus sp. ZRK36]QYY37100.1 Holliday junction resolvase RuvX [Ruficoccus sp. ZRK36]